jgi:hypothetical protein
MEATGIRHSSSSSGPYTVTWLPLPEGCTPTQSPARTSIHPNDAVVLSSFVKAAFGFVVETHQLPPAGQFLPDLACRSLRFDRPTRGLIDDVIDFVQEQQ